MQSKDITKYLKEVASTSDEIHKKVEERKSELKEIQEDIGILDNKLGESVSEVNRERALIIKEFTFKRIDFYIDMLKIALPVLIASISIDVEKFTQGIFPLNINTLRFSIAILIVVLISLIILTFKAFTSGSKDVEEMMLRLPKSLLKELRGKGTKLESMKSELEGYSEALLQEYEKLSRIKQEMSTRKSDSKD